MGNHTAKGWKWDEIREKSVSDECEKGGCGAGDVGDCCGGIKGERGEDVASEDGIDQMIVDTRDVSALLWARTIYHVSHASPHD